MASDSFSFLLTTDNHMGYKKDDAIRYKDSFMAFAEALEIARVKDVDFVLLGGDLFHENRPSSDIEHRCIKIIRKHIQAQADRAVSFRRTSGSFSHSRKLSYANFEDPKMKISCPIITIHGNHDNPTGPRAQSVCEKLASSGLLNYFGLLNLGEKTLVVEPIILEKGEVKIALYGMGFVPESKLKVLFDKKQVVFMEPPPDTFNILIVHQNRVAYQKDRCIPDSTYPTIFHLIVRGHEHDTQKPEIIPESDVNGMVYQPGSTVATSIGTMESASKKVAVISIKVANPKGDRATRYEADYQLIDLKCCRAMLMKDISQKEIFKYVKEASQQASKITALEFKNLSRRYIVSCIENQLKQYEDDRRHLKLSQSSTSDSDSELKKLSFLDRPLMRIRLEYVARNERFDELEIISKFFPQRVANKDMILFKKQKLIQSDEGIKNVTFASETEDDEQEEFDFVSLSEGRRDTIDATIEKYFLDKPSCERLKALSITEYINAVRDCVEDGNVIAKVLNKKKMDILQLYGKAIGDSDYAAKKFFDEAYVEKWFLEMFAQSSAFKVIDAGGDVEDNYVQDNDVEIEIWDDDI